MPRWYGAVGALGFGLIGERRPVPEFIPECALLIGCLIGLALHLAGNFISVYILLR